MAVIVTASAVVLAGTIQVSGDGQPIIIMADRQTYGGYARITMSSLLTSPPSHR